MRRFTLLIVFVVALVSCAAEDTIYWDLPPDMLPEERAAFGEACERWNYVAIRQQFINEPGGGGTHRVFLLIPEHLVNQTDIDGDGKNDTTGELQRSSHTMNLRRWMNLDSFRVNAAHEMGHALGLDHHPGDGVMAVPASQIDFSEGDLAECRRVNACR